MPIDYTTPIGQIRAIINDTNEEALEFQDDQLDAYFQMSYCNPTLAGIMALRALVAKYASSAGDTYRLDTIEYEEGKSKASLYQSLLNNLEKSIAEGTNPLVVGVPRVYGVYAEDRKENYQRMADGEINPPKTTDYEYSVGINKTGQSRRCLCRRKLHGY